MPAVPARKLPVLAVPGKLGATAKFPAMSCLWQATVLLPVDTVRILLPLTNAKTSLHTHHTVLIGLAKDTALMHRTAYSWDTTAGSPVTANWTPVPTVRTYPQVAFPVHHTNRTVALTSTLPWENWWQPTAGRRVVNALRPESKLFCWMEPSKLQRRFPNISLGFGRIQHRFVRWRDKLTWHLRHFAKPLLASQSFWARRAKFGNGDCCLLQTIYLSRLVSLEKT